MKPLLDDHPPQIPIDLRALQRRAQQYSRRCEAWMAGQASPHSPHHAADEDVHPVAIVSRLSVIVPTEIDRALAGWLLPENETRDLIADPGHAAALALTAIEHSRGAWLSLVKHQHIRALTAQPFIADLVWLKHEVERAFPPGR